jgi:hypothetical protein
MQKQLSLKLSVANECVAIFARSQKNTSETTTDTRSQQYINTIETEKENFDTVRMFCLTKQQCSTRKYVDYYYGVIPLRFIEQVICLYNYNICEVLTTFPYRLFFDIDDSSRTINLSSLQQLMKKYFGLRKSEYTVAGYETDKKNSYHVVAKNFTITSYDDLTNLKQIIKAINTSEGYETNVFDPAVYTKNRNMKCVYQSKIGGTTATPLHPSEDSSKYNLKEFFITSFIPSDATPYFSSGKLNVDLSEKVKTKSEALPSKPRELPNNFIWSTNDMMKADQTTVLKLLEITPYYSDIPEEQAIIDDHGFRRRVACLCAAYGLTEQHFNTWFYKTNPTSTRKEKVHKWWVNNDFNHEFFCYIPKYVAYLSRWYPCLSVENPNTGYFVNSFDLGLPTTNITRIEPEHYSTSHRVLIFNIGMGGGKTTTTLQHLKQHIKKSFVWLAPRQTLVQNTSQRMNKEFEINHITHMDVGANKSKLVKANHLIICNQSLHYLDYNQSYDIVVIDEIETVLLSWLDESTHGKNLKENFSRFCNIIKSASKIILLDAFVTTKTINLLSDLGISERDIKLYESEYKPATKNLIYNKTEQEIVDKIVTAIVNKEKCYIFYPFKRPSKKHMGIIEFDTHIKEQVKQQLLKTVTTAEDKLAIYENPPKSLLYFAESKEKNNLGEINQLWAETDYILTTSSITVGVNYENKDFHHVFILASGSTNAPRDIIQSSMRIRYPQNTDINYFLFDVSLRDIEKFPDYFHETDLDASAIYKNLVIQNLREIQSGFVDAFYKLCGLTNYKLDIVQEAMYKIKQRKNYVNTMFETANLMEYSKVPAITDEDTINTIQNKMYGRAADMVDRLTVERFYFDIQFRNLDETERAHIWNTNRKEFFTGIRSEFIKMVETDNGVSNIVDIDPRKFTISDTTAAYIAKHYSIVKSKKFDTKAIQVINQILGYEALTTKTDKTKHKLTVVSELTKTLYGFHLKKIQADEAERTANEIQFLEDTKLNMTQDEWKSEWFSKMNDSDIVEVDTWFGDKTLMNKFELPWKANPESFHLNPVPQKHENKLLTSLDPQIYKPLTILPPLVPK